MEELGEPEAGERNAALLAMPLGIEPPEEAAQPDAATRSGCARRCSRRLAPSIEAIALRRPLVLAIDDIHWADEGMLDLIDHLARWVRGAAAARLPRPRRAARAPARLGRRHGETPPRSRSSR